MLDRLRIARRLACVLVWTLFCVLVQSLLLPLPWRAPERFARIYWRGVRRLMGMRITVIGKLAQERPVVFIVNHSSWLDIVALGSVLPACFVAKGEIARWPVFSLIAKLGRTIFVSRTRAGVARERSDMLLRLKRGDNVILFPEGTTSDGNRLLPFQTTFLAIAQADPPPYIQPVTLVFDRINNLPVHKFDRPMLSWYGDMDLATHLPRIARLESFHATLVIDAAIPPGTYPNRKILTAALESRLSANAALLRQGRSVTPLTAPPPTA